MTRIPLSPGDLSTARTLEEFVAALRRAEKEFDPAQITNPECATMKIEYEAIRCDRLQIADDLERLLKNLNKGKT